MNIWVNYNNNWNTERGIEILNSLTRRRKLDQVGYQIPWKMSKYPAAEWQDRFASIHAFLCPEFNFLTVIFMTKIIENMMPYGNFSFDEQKCNILG